jgi:hypothetical protein
MAELLDEWFASMTISEAGAARERFVRFMQDALRNQDTLFEACADFMKAEISARKKLLPETAGNPRAFNLQEAAR